MSDSTWALIEMKNNLKKDIEATPVICSCSAKLKTEKLSEALGVRRGRRLVKSAEESAFDADMGEVYKIS